MYYDSEYDGRSKTKHLSAEELILLANINNKQKKCHCLLCKTKDGYWTGGFNSSDYEYTPAVYKCVKCGLTNKHGVDKIDDYISLIRKDRYLKENNYLSYLYRNNSDQLFKEKFGSINPLEDNLNLISNEVLECYDLEKLYKEAIELMPDGNNNEIFNLMKELNKEKVKTKGGRYYD